MLTACFISGVAQLLSGHRPVSINQALVSPWLQYIWCAMLALGSGTALLGVFWRNILNGYRLESIGLLTTGISGGIYGLCVIFYSGFTGVFAACTVFGFGAACVVRYFAITKLLASLPHVPVEELPQPPPDGESA